MANPSPPKSPVNGGAILFITLVITAAIWGLLGASKMTVRLERGFVAKGGSSAIAIWR